jgi:hypothetical protein
MPHVFLQASLRFPALTPTPVGRPPRRPPRPPCVVGGTRLLPTTTLRRTTWPSAWTRSQNRGRRRRRRVRTLQ